MPSNHPDWTHVRIRRSTKERLEAFVRSKRAYYEKTGRGLSCRNGCPSVNEMLECFLDQEDDHKERSRRAKMRAKARRLNEERGHVVFTHAPDGVDFVIPEDILGRESNGSQA